MTSSGDDADQEPYIFRLVLVQQIQTDLDLAVGLFLREYP